MSWETLDILLLDDEEDSLYLSREAIANYVSEEHIHCAKTVEEAIAVLKNQTIQLAFLDIELTHGNGFTLTEYIHRNYPSVAVVILTGHVDLGAKSYDYEPLDFLTKPVDVLRMERTFQRYEESQKKQQGLSRIMIETGSGFALLDPGDIQYISKERYYVEIHCRNENTYKVNYSLDRLEAMFAGFDFFRMHQSYLVPAARIVRVQSARFGNSYEAILDDGTFLPVSRAKYAKLKEYISAQSLRLL